MDLRRRFKEYFNVNHLLRNKNLAICAALGKYGYSLFSLEVLEYCDPSNILKREQYYLDLIKPQYNILKTAGSFVGFKHTEETKNKLAVLFKGNKNSQNHPAAVSVEVLDLESGETSIFSSARKAAVALNISNSTVMYKLRGNPSISFPPPLGGGRGKLIKIDIFLITLKNPDILVFIYLALLILAV